MTTISILKIAQQDDAPGRVTFSIIATAPSRKIENITRPVILDVGQTRMIRIAVQYSGLTVRQTRMTSDFKQCAAVFKKN